MYVIPELRLNLYQDVRIPSAKDLYSKLGLRSVTHPGSVGSDGDFTDPVNVGQTMSKIDSLRLGEIEAYRQYADSVNCQHKAHNEPSVPSVEPQPMAE